MRRTNLALLIAVVAMSLAAWAGEAPLVASSIVPAARGTVSFEHDKNGNLKYHISTKNLASPQQLTPAKSAYVVWLKPRDGQPQNVGVLTVNSNLEGSLSGMTPAKAFDVTITAEDNPSVTQPTGPEILHGAVQAR
jgi:anti-sigma-K factor RskA